ncbi:hypothetical protein NOR_00719 [Metarhizium rileyi]|uniref:Uncharacterized protein n=1 Tax=Metarhizium rileyi (strain RCEF 4871) TaxID=1649241 RepID=A0A167JHH3_METRR|nr:hypothetical protein NOR_00719 [Metarhizium rileyi RCEF 4871]TWU73126.1 hypothetical protein ED733_000959 [Metarhizium rileyi]
MSVQSSSPEPDVLRDVPCEGCIRAAIAGKGGRGRCFEVTKGRSKRCRSCKDGNHPCRPCHTVLVPIAKRMVLALEVDTKMYDRCRQALKLQLDLLAESDSVYEDVDSEVRARTAAAAVSVAEGKRIQVKALLDQVADLLV